jgi:hypothetical protein
VLAKYEPYKARMRAEWVMKQGEHAALDKFLVLRKLSLRQASTRFPKFVIRLRVFANELRKAKGTSKLMMLVPLFDLKFLFEFAAGHVGTSNRRH